MSKQYKLPPSTLLGIPPSIRAYYVDRGIWLFCSRIEGEMEEAGRRASNPVFARTARLKILNSYIDPDSVKTGKGMYKDPAATVKPKEPEVQDLGANFFG